MVQVRQVSGRQVLGYCLGRSGSGYHHLGMERERHRLGQVQRVTEHQGLGCFLDYFPGCCCCCCSGRCCSGHCPGCFLDHCLGCCSDHFLDCCSGYHLEESQLVLARQKSQHSTKEHCLPVGFRCCRSGRCFPDRCFLGCFPGYCYCCFPDHQLGQQTRMRNQQWTKE